MSNLLTAKTALENIDKESQSPDILVPIGGNAFLKAELKEKGKVLTGVGADVVMEKPIPDALSTIDTQLEQLKTASEKIESNIREFDARMAKLEPELQKMGSSLREKAEKKKK